MIWNKQYAIRYRINAYCSKNLIQDDQNYPIFHGLASKYIVDGTLFWKEEKVC